MRKFCTFALAVVSAALPVFPVLAQSAATQPALTAEQAIQLFEEAGFVLKDGKPTNRCGNTVNPRIAFIDLNDDRIAEAHVADVDPGCYAKPGAYFAILAQQPDKSWKRLIAEDGITSFQRTRTSGWNNLELDARYSACPGLRRYNGADYGASACAVTAFGHTQSAAAAPAPIPSAQSAAATTASLQGTREQQLAQLFRNLVPASTDRSWDSAKMAFPGAQWEPRETHKANWYGSTLSQSGSIRLGSATYLVGISGTPERVNELSVSGPGDDNVEWEAIVAEMAPYGVSSRTIGCLSPTGFGFVRLTSGGKSAVMHKFVNYGSAVPSTDHYNITPDNPFDDKSEAEVAADKSLC